MARGHHSSCYNRCHGNRHFIVWRCHGHNLCNSIDWLHQTIYCDRFLMDVSAYGISDCLLVLGALEAVEDNKDSVVVE